MIEFEHYESGRLFGIRYRFSEEGDALPTHQHELDTAHNIVVLHGRVRFESDDFSCDLLTGDVFDFDGTKLHTIRCIEPGSRILNLMLQGIPPGYESLSAEDRKGVLRR